MKSTSERTLGSVDCVLEKDGIVQIKELGEKPKHFNNPSKC
jgi:hypothetical protein